jgi:hypothetical protein
VATRVLQPARRQALACYTVEAPAPGAALELERRALLTEYLPTARRAQSCSNRPSASVAKTRMAGSSKFLRQAQGRCFCDGCLAIELHVKPLDVQSALGGTAPATDRGHGRCSVCGQTLTVTRVPAQ